MRNSIKKIIAGLILILMIGFPTHMYMNLKSDYRALEFEKAELNQQIQSLQEELKAYKSFNEGPYTMITDLASFMYINGVSEDVEGAVHWTDVNGVSGFDVTINGTHYRYVEGHIELPQLHLYAPYMNVVSDSVWP